MVIFSILSYTHKKGPSFLGLWWHWNDPLAGGEERKQHRTGLSLWARALGGGLWSPLLVYYFLVGIKILVLPLLSWKMLLPGDLWCFSWNRQNKRARWIYGMIRFIYIHPKSANIKNELHKKIIFRDNSRPCSPTIIFLTRIFLTLLFSVAGLSGEPLCGLHTPGTALNPGPPLLLPRSRAGVPPFWMQRWI